ncbi:MAG: alpha-L-fucosidase [Chitinispirillaceae bacterium]|nr:alpha-L-fucosidase [Chitinispirillaceae bacterium]
MNGFKKTGVSVKRNRLLSVAGIVAVAAAGLLLRCETASGPTPYRVFDGKTYSSTSITIGTGSKIIEIPASLPIAGGGRRVRISNESGDLVMNGVIISYERTSGELTVDVENVDGTGTDDKWDVVLGKTDAELQDSIRAAYSALGFGMFIHFNMSTFDRCCCDTCYSVSGEWGFAKVDMAQFAPSKLDCGQWADVAKSAGCTYMVLTAKHHDGFCIWPSEKTEYCVKNAGIKRDIVREFVDSARTRGLKVGLYYSIRDLSNGFKMDFVEGQLTELLSNYGEIICLWFDGWGWGPGYNNVPYDAVRRIIKKSQPNCLIVENNHEYNTIHSEIIEYEMPIDGPPPLSNIRPAEGNEPIRLDDCWFWHPEKECEILPAQRIVDQLEENNSRHASYLLDLTPDTTGLIPECQVQRMKEVGELRGISQE